MDHKGAFLVILTYEEVSDSVLSTGKSSLLLLHDSLGDLH